MYAFIEIKNQITHLFITQKSKPDYILHSCSADSTFQNKITFCIHAVLIHHSTQEVSHYHLGDLPTYSLHRSSKSKPTHSGYILTVQNITQNQRSSQQTVKNPRRKQQLGPLSFNLDGRIKITLKMTFYMDQLCNPICS